MNSNNSFFADLSKFASGASGAMMDMKREIETMVRTQVEAMLARFNLVQREEFDALKDMVVQMKQQHADIQARLTALEATQKPKE